MDPAFQTEFNILLNLHSTSCQTLLSLKATMKNEDNTNWSMDYEFFKGQLKHPQTTSMSNITDRVLAQCILMKEEKAAKALAYMEKNRGEPSAIVQQSDDSKAIFSRKMISEENTIEKTKHRNEISDNIVQGRRCWLK